MTDEREFHPNFGLNFLCFLALIVLEPSIFFPKWLIHKVNFIVDEQERLHLQTVDTIGALSPKIENEHFFLSVFFFEGLVVAEIEKEIACLTDRDGALDVDVHVAVVAG